MSLTTMIRAAAGALPLIPRGDRLPGRTLTVDELSIDRSNVAAYCALTGLRYGNAVPLTYPFALTFPSVMELITAFDFPFSAIGAVHVQNVITRYRPIAVTDTVRATVRAENLREHRKGLLVDVSTYGSWVRFFGGGSDLLLRREECVLHGTGEIALGASFADLTVPTVKFSIS